MDSKGKITGKKKGSTTVTVKNNGVSAIFTIKVINPTLSETSVTVVKGQTVKVKITGKVSTINNKYKSTKYAKITTKSKKAKTIVIKGKKTTKKTVVKIRVNGVWLSLKVKVLAHAEPTFSLKKKNNGKITLNLDELKMSADIDDQYEIYTNSYSLFKKGQLTEKQHNNYLEKLYFKKTKYTLKDKGIVKLSGSTVTPLKKGKTSVTVKYWNKTITIPIEVTKITETTYEGKKAKACYSYKEVYNTLKSSFYDYVIKGNAPKYYAAVRCFKAKNLVSKMYKYAEQEFDNGQNFSYYLLDNNWLDIGADSLVLYSNGTSEYDEENEYDVLDFGYQQKHIREIKEIYNETKKIFNEINIDSLETNVEKIIALEYWRQAYCNYAEPSNEYILGESTVILTQKGVCHHFSLAFMYFSTLLNVPCVYVSGGNHAWNAVEYNDKWYFIDYTNNNLFRGTDSFHYSAKEFEPQKITVSKNDIFTKEEDASIKYIISPHKDTSNGKWYIAQIPFSHDYFTELFSEIGQDDFIARLYIKKLNKVYNW